MSIWSQKKNVSIMSSTFPCFHSNHTSMYSEGHVPYRDHVKKSVIGHKVYSRPSLGLSHSLVISHFLSIKKKIFHMVNTRCIHSHNRNRLHSAIYAPGVIREEESQRNAETCSPEEKVQSSLGICAGLLPAASPTADTQVPRVKWCSTIGSAPMGPEGRPYFETRKDGSYQCQMGETGTESKA